MSMAFSAFGVTIDLVVDDPAVFDAIREVLPPGWTAAESQDADTVIELRGDRVLVDGEEVRRVGRSGASVAHLDAAIRSRLGELAPLHVFVHAGVVALHGSAIVLPGSTMAGKTTLVAALVDAGAEYLSDEFAVLDKDGLVHPYPKPLSIRLDPGRRNQTEVSIAEHGGRVAVEPVSVAVIAVTRFVPDVEWRPARRTAAEGAMALFSNALPARLRPAQTLATLTRACANAIVLEGPRGNAPTAARELLQLLQG
jgi:hypothetical protein